MYEPRIMIERARLTGDPEIRNTQNGKTFISVNLAVNPGRYDQNRQWQEGASQFFSVTSFNDRDVQAWQQLVKGDMVTATGTLSLRQYQGRDGVQHTSMQLNHATLGKLLTAPRQGQGQVQNAPQNAAYGSNSFGQTTSFGADPWGDGGADEF